MQPDHKKSWRAIENAELAGNEPTLPLVDCLTDKAYGSRGHGTDWRQENWEAATGRPGPKDKDRLKAAAILRVMGPLKRAWEYPMLFTQFQTDPTTYLEKQIALVAVGKAIDKPTAGEANIAAQIKKISQGKNPKTGEDLWRTLEWGDRDKCADDLLTSLQTLNGDLFKIVGECK